METINIIDSAPAPQVRESLRLKRRAIELGHLDAWPTHGRGSIHLENSRHFRPLLEAVLHLTRLRARGERNARSPILKEIHFNLDTLPEEFCGFKILHLSDIHADSLPGLAEAICRKVRDVAVDLCVLTGDYRFEVSGPSHSAYRDMEKILRCVNARHGIVGILGNHDFAEEATKLERMGVRMLVNQSWQLENGNSSLWFIGLDDPHYYGCDDLPGALSAVPPDGFKVLLVHTPELIKEAEERGVDLYLCGHTHGGQICLPIIGPLIFNANCRRRFARGTWQYKRVQGYTSAGVGTSCVPVRFLCPPEIGLIQLHRVHHPDSVA